MEKPWKKDMCNVESYEKYLGQKWNMIPQRKIEKQQQNMYIEPTASGGVEAMKQFDDLSCLRTNKHPLTASVLALPVPCEE
jgi:hypothetical protein